MEWCAGRRSPWDSATLLGYVASSGDPVTGGALLLTYTSGYVAPLLVAATMTGSLQRIMSARAYTAWVTPASGFLLVAGGTYGFLSRVAPHWSGGGLEEARPLPLCWDSDNMIIAIYFLLYIVHMYFLTNHHWNTLLVLVHEKLVSYQYLQRLFAKNYLAKHRILLFAKLMSGKNIHFFFCGPLEKTIIRLVPMFFLRKRCEIFFVNHWNGERMAKKKKNFPDISFLHKCVLFLVYN